MKKKQKKVGLALGSGGVKGLAHLGVIQSLHNHRVPIDFIAGTSSGAVIGGLYAALGDVKAVIELLTISGWREIFDAFGDPNWRSVLVHGDKLEDFLNRATNYLEIKQAKIPFMAVATDLTTGEAVVIDGGKIAQAIRASASMPYLLEPKMVDGHCFIDGGCSMPVPIEPLRDHGAKVVIAVNLDVNPALGKIAADHQFSFASLVNVSIDLLQYHLADKLLKTADVVIQPNVPPHVSVRRMFDPISVISAGAAAAEKRMPEIIKLFS